MDRASAIIMGFLGVVLLSIVALFWVLTSDTTDNNEAASLLETRASTSVGAAGGTARSTGSAAVGTSRGTSQSPATPGSTDTLPTVTGSPASSIATVPTAPPPISPGPSSPVTSSPAPGSVASTTAPNPASASPELLAVLGRVDAGGIRFAYRSDDLSPAAVTLLDELALRLNREVPVRLSVAGHTDSDGAPADNAVLSARRAATVVDHLVARGVAAGRLEIRAAGHLEPLADNTSDAGRSANRRVEIKLLGAGR